MLLKYLLAAVAVYGQSAWLVKDVAQAVPGSSNPRDAVQVGNAVYFAASSPNGNLYKYDITTRRVSLIKEFNGISNLLAVNNKVVFSTSSNDLWVTDGTAGGTTLIGLGTRFHPGDPAAKHSVVVGGYLYFGCFTAMTGGTFAFCRTDGTAAGTTLVSGGQVGSVAELNGAVFFSLFGNRIWKTDGTVAGTVLVAGPVEGLTGVANLKRFGNHIYFSGSTAASGFEIWKSDGTTAGTAQFADVYPGPTSSNPAFLDVVGSSLLFLADSPSIGCELWKTDGTAAGTVLVQDIFSGPFGSCNPGNQGVFASANGLLFYHAFHPTLATVLIRTDGTAVGTYSISQSSGGGIGVVGSAVVYSGRDFLNGSELWKTDGTAGGTGVIADFCPGGCSGDPFVIGAASNGKVLLAGTTAATGQELWDSNGTPSGTALVADINAADAGSQPGSAVAYGGAYYYLTRGADSRVQLWKTDGTGTGTTFVATTEFMSTIPPLYRAGSYLVFLSPTARLWRSDGTGVGTENYHPDPLAIGASAIMAGGKLYFTGPGGNQLHVTDGTAAGTASLGIEVPGAMNATLGAELPDGRLIFTGIRRSPTYSEEPWVTDGTGTNTAMLAQLVTNGVSQPRNYVRAGSYVFFTSNFGLGRSDGSAGGTHTLGGNGVLAGPFFSIGNEAFYHCIPGNSLCKSGPSPNSSVVLTSLAYPTAGVTGRGWDVANLSGKVVFRGVSSLNGDVEPWITDGTAGGTFYLKDIVLGGAPSLSGDPLNFLGTGAAVFFSAQSENTALAADRELWVTDGSSPGTKRVADIFPGNRVFASSTVNRASNPVPMVALPDGRALVSAESPLRGRELWMAHPTACAVPLDVTPQLTITAGAPVFNRNSGRFVQQVSIRNNGTPLDGLAYVLGGLNASVTVPSSHGVTHCASPVGSPYRDIGAIGAGQTVSLALELIAPAGTPLTYTPKVVSAVDGPR